MIESDIGSGRRGRQQRHTVVLSRAVKTSPGTAGEEIGFAYDCSVAGQTDKADAYIAIGSRSDGGVAGYYVARLAEMRGACRGIFHSGRIAPPACNFGVGEFVGVERHICGEQDGVAASEILSRIGNSHQHCLCLKFCFAYRFPIEAGNTVSPAFRHGFAVYAKRIGAWFQTPRIVLRTCPHAIKPRLRYVYHRQRIVGLSRAAVLIHAQHGGTEAVR